MVLGAGESIIMRLFETHPEAQDIFINFKGIPKKELRDHPQIRAHSLRVLGIVDKVVSRINEENKIEAVLKDLGHRHGEYNADFDRMEVGRGIDYMAEQFVFALQPSLKDVWTSEVEKAWTDLFKHITYYMKHGMFYGT